ncbi:MAG: AAA family ATPase, partial [Patescibacteria group bacterium]
MADSRPLAELLRPTSLDDVIGQEHLVGEQGLIRKLLATDFLPSMVFWGPPGSGKTTLAYLIATLTTSHFVAESAVTTSLSAVRQIIKEAAERLITGKRTVLFIDEIHRFNKAQQDALLPHVEKGTVIFIGATTENPSFEVISPLLSRCRVLMLKPLDEAALTKILGRALTHINKTIDADGTKFLLEVANGDARALLTTLEIASSLARP